MSQGNALKTEDWPSTRFSELKAGEPTILEHVVVPVARELAADMWLFVCALWRAKPSGQPKITTDDSPVRLSSGEDLPDSRVLSLERERFKRRR